jgi:hypothetical protein
MRSYFLKQVLFAIATILPIEPRINACFFLQCVVCFPAEKKYFLFIPDIPYMLHIILNAISWIKAKILSLGMAALQMWLRIPILVSLLPRVNCPILRSLAQHLPPFPLFLPIQAIRYCSYRCHYHARIFFCRAQVLIKFVYNYGL